MSLTRDVFAKQHSRTSIIYIKLVMIKHAAGRQACQPFVKIEITNWAVAATSPLKFDVFEG